MGAASSRGNYRSSGRKRSPASKHVRGKKKRRRSVFRQVKPTVTTQPAPPIKYRSSHHHSSVTHRYGLPPPAYARIPPLAPISYPRYMPMLYNNYSMSPYRFSREPQMMPLQRFQPMSMPQSAPMVISPPSFAMPNIISPVSPMSMPQQASSSMYPAYSSPPYSAGIPMSMPYVPQPTPIPFNYTNAGVSAPISMGIPSPATPYPSAFPMTGGKITTDWTGGGKISPGFLGPPI